MHDRTVAATREAPLGTLRWHQELVSGDSRALREIANRENLPATYVRRIHELAFLSPDAMGVVSDQAPATLTLEALRKGFPLDWEEQRQHFGI